MKKIKNLNDRTEYFASEGLVEELKTLLNDEKAVVINFAFTDYGGDFFDSVCIDYFTEKYPNNIVSETTSWSGKNAFVFGTVAEQFMDCYSNYPLGFEDIEDYYYEKESKAEEKFFDEFKEDFKDEEWFDEEKYYDYMRENLSGYYSVMSSGTVDYCYDDVYKKLVTAGILKKLEEEN